MELLDIALELLDVALELLDGGGLTLLLLLNIALELLGLALELLGRCGSFSLGNSIEGASAQDKVNAMANPKIANTMLAKAK